MPTVSIQEAQAKLTELIHRLSPGEEVVVTENDQPVAKIVLTTLPAAAPTQRKLGTLRGTVIHVASDFDAPLTEFEDYMP